MTAALFQPILISEELVLKQEEIKLLREEYSYDSFITWATRKLKGYSVAEIDYFARQITKIKSYEDRFDILERIRDARFAAGTKMQKALKGSIKGDRDDQHKVANIRDHIEVLKTLEAKAKSFDIISHAESEKQREEQEHRAAKEKKEHEAKEELAREEARKREEAQAGQRDKSEEEREAAEKARLEHERAMELARAGQRSQHLIGHNS